MLKVLNFEHRLPLLKVDVVFIEGVLLVAVGTSEIHVFYFISTPFFSAQPGVAYLEAVFEPQVCLDVCLANQRTFVYEIKKVVLN